MFSSVSRPHLQLVNLTETVDFGKLVFDVLDESFIVGGIEKKEDCLFEDRPGGPDGEDGEEISAEGVCQLPVSPGMVVGWHEVDD